MPDPTILSAIIERMEFGGSEGASRVVSLVHDGRLEAGVGGASFRNAPGSDLILRVRDYRDDGVVGLEEAEVRRLTYCDVGGVWGRSSSLVISQMTTIRYFDICALRESYDKDLSLVIYLLSLHCEHRVYTQVSYEGRLCTYGESVIFRFCWAMIFLEVFTMTEVREVGKGSEAGDVSCTWEVLV
ncbi:hypothetical protein Tco_0065756 [Tanacetum coccineum]